MVTASIGILTGVTLTAGAVRLAGGEFLGVPSLDLPTVLVVIVGAMVLALAAALGPARRAADVTVDELLRVD